MTADLDRLVWRPLTPADARAWADLLNAVEAEDKVGENYSLEDAAQELEDPDLDLERGTLAAFDGEVMAGYSMAHHKPLAEREHRVRLDGDVHPAYRRRGIGRELLAAGIASARELHALHHPGLPLWIDAQSLESVVGAVELYRGAGMSPVRWYQHMERPLSDALPDPLAVPGLVFEPYSAENDAEFHAIRNEAFQDHWGMAPVTGEGWKNSVNGPSFRPELSILLRDAADGTAAGMLVTSHWEADTAVTGIRETYINLIGTRRAYRKRGVASALITWQLRAAAERGFDRASLEVDADSPTGAVGLYERHGFAVKHTSVRYTLEG